MIRKALLVGINYYQHVSSLKGCITDATKMAEILGHHADGSTNFSAPKLLTSDSEQNLINRFNLKDSVRELYEDEADIALFYFSGHGYLEDIGGYLNTSECERGDDGFSLHELMYIIYNSPVKYKFIFLDCCHSGIIGDNPKSSNLAEITNGTSILTASTADQSAFENQNGQPGGVFTNLLIDALEGSVANLVGDVTSGSIYAHIDRAFGPWSKQRPVFKTNVKTFVSLRKATPPISREILQSISKLFPQRNYKFPLDPAYEPERSEEQLKDAQIPPPDVEKNKVFAQLQQLRSVNLVQPEGASQPHMWHAAMESKFCVLTPLGEHYRQLASDDLI